MVENLRIVTAGNGRTTGGRTAARRLPSGSCALSKRVLGVQLSIEFVGNHFKAGAQTLGIKIDLCRARILTAPFEPPSAVRIAHNLGDSFVEKQVFDWL